MTDEQQVRSLLTLAAELPDDLQPPLAPLLHCGRRKRRVRAISSVLTVMIVVAAAFALPPIIDSLRAWPAAHHGIPAGPTTRLTPGPTAAQIARYRWSTLPASPLGARSQPVLAWTGTELLEFGGTKNGNTQNDGAAFSPATGRWHRIASPVPYNVGFSNAVDVWTGRQLFVTNGQFLPCPSRGRTPANCWPHAGLYDPATNSWSSTKLPNQMYGLDLTSAMWTGRDVVLAGTSAHLGRIGVAAYNPRTHGWSVITPRLPAGHPSRYVAMVSTPGRLLLWSLWDRVTTYKHGYSDRAGVDVLSLGRDGAWHIVTGRWPQNQFVTAPTYTGSAILLSPETVWCGTRCKGLSVSGPGDFVDPATFTPTAIPPGPLAETEPVFIWAGRSIIAVNLHTQIGNNDHFIVREDDMALYDPATSSWQRLPAPPRYPELAVTPIWADRELFALTASGKLFAFRS